MANFSRSRAAKSLSCPVDADGALDLHLLDKSIRPDTAIVSVMWANNETGVVFPVEEIAAICRSKNVLFHTDATQVPGKMKIDVDGTGRGFPVAFRAQAARAQRRRPALRQAPDANSSPISSAAIRSAGKRGGTENVASIVGFGRAAELALDRSRGREHPRARLARPAGKHHSARAFPNTIRNGAKEPRLPNTSNIAFDFVEAEGILLAAGPTGHLRLQRFGLHHRLARSVARPDRHGHQARARRGCVRFSLGIYNTDEEVDYLLTHIPLVIARLREAAPEKPSKARHAKPADDLAPALLEECLQTLKK